MRKETVLMIPAVLFLSILAFAGLSAPAAAQTATIDPGQSFMATYTATNGDSIAYHWTASQSVTFTISDPNGDTILDVSSAQRSGIREVTQTGDYLLLWTNHHSTSVVLTYEVTVLPFHAGGISLIAAIAVVLIAIIALVIIVLIIFVVFREDRRRTEELYTQQQAVYAGPTVMPPTAEGKCSRCGAAAKPDSTFCEKCGARLR